MSGMASIATFFDGLNWRLRKILHPDPLNISRESLCALARLSRTRVETIDGYVGLLDFSLLVMPKPPRVNRRSSQVSNTQKSANSTLPNLSTSLVASPSSSLNSR